MNALGRITLVEEVGRQGSLNIPQKPLTDANSLFGRAQSALLVKDSKIENLITNDPEKALIFVDAYINRGIAQWFELTWPQKPRAFIPTNPVPNSAVLTDPNVANPALTTPNFQATVPAVDPANFPGENSYLFNTALSFFRDALLYVQAIKEQHGDNGSLSEKITEIEARAACFRDAAIIINFSLEIDFEWQQDELGNYHCLATGANLTVDPEDYLIIQTIFDSPSVAKNLSVGVETFNGGNEPQ